MFGFRKRRSRRRPQDPMKQLGNAAGKAIGAVIVGAVLNFLRKK
jgi:hypothetical protein